MNISKFTKLYKHYPKGLGGMLKYLKMEFIGRPHNGYDDTKNTARIFEKMILDGYTI